MHSSAIIVASGIMIGAQAVRADESGTGFWMSGQYASMAAVPPSPGFTLTTTFYYYQGQEGRDEKLPRGKNLESNVDVSSPLSILTPSWAPDFKILGGQPSFSLSVVGGYQSVSADVTLLPSGATASDSDSLWGFGDLYPMINIAWNEGSSNWMVYLTGGVPVGSYDADRLANIGLGHGAIDVGGAYTYLNEKTGLEVSGTLGFTYNFENPDTDYTSGVDTHFDWAVSQFLNQHMHVGVVGYLYYQLTPDDYPTAGLAGQLRKEALGDNKSSVAGVGPEIGYLFGMGDKQAYANVRAYYEFAADNRPQGFSVYFNLEIPF